MRKAYLKKWDHLSLEELYQYRTSCFVARFDPVAVLARRTRAPIAHEFDGHDLMVRFGALRQ